MMPVQSLPLGLAVLTFLLSIASGKLEKPRERNLLSKNRPNIVDSQLEQNH